MKSTTVVADLAARISGEPQMYFAGAGLSNPSGIPVFRDLYRHILVSILGAEEARDEAEILLERLRPEVLAESLAFLFGSRLFDFYRCFLQAQPNANHQFLARALERGSCIFTTNVDTLIEDCCEQLGIGYELCVDDADYDSFWERRSPSGQINACGCLFKLRGSLARDEEQFVRSIPLTIEDEGKGLSDNRERAVQECLRQYDVTVLGYSGMDHFSVQPLLVETSTTRSMNWHWYRRGADPLVQSRPIFEREMQIARQDIVDGVLDHPDEQAKISMNEILLARSNSARIVGDTSRLLAAALRTLGEKPIRLRQKRISFPTPDWVSQIPQWKRQLLKARLLRLAGEYAQATVACKQASKRARRNYDRGLVLEEQGSIYRADSIVATDDMARESYAMAAELFEKAGDLEKAINARIDQANILRRQRGFDQSQEHLKDIRQQIAESKLDSRSKKKIECFLLSTLALRRMRLRSASREENLEALQWINEAVELARESGHLRRLASCLNSSGLLQYQMAKSTKDLLIAEESLKSSYRIHRRLTDNRGCFQAARNLGLVYQKLAMKSRAKGLKKDRWEEALANFYRAAEHVARISVGVRGESLEANFRIGETLVQLERYRQARPILDRIVQGQHAIEAWNNEGRALELVMKCVSSPAKLRSKARRILEIYHGAMQSETRRKIILGGKENVVFKTVISILTTAIHQLRMDDTKAGRELRKKLVELRREIRDQNG